MKLLSDDENSRKNRTREKSRKDGWDEDGEQIVVNVLIRADEKRKELSPFDGVSEQNERKERNGRKKQR